MLQVHKILLAATSDYFRVMLAGPMKESKENQVDLKALSADALQLIIDFIYSGEMELDLENLMDVLNAGSHLQVQSALDLCSDFMISLLTFANADQLLNIADMYSLNKVTEYYKNKVLQNFEDFSNTEQFMCLSASQLSRYLASDGLRIRSESLLCDIVAKWYNNDQKRIDGLESVVKCIRFGIATELQLQHLQQNWLTRQFPTMLNYISEGLKYHRDSGMGHPWLSDLTKIRSQDASLTLIHQGSSYRRFEVTAYNHDDGKFYQLATDITGSRDCRISCVDNFVYICRVVDCGGGTLMNSLLRFDPRHLALQELTPCRRLRIDPVLIANGNWLYMTGGTNENFAFLDSVECYDVRSNSWVDLGPLPEAVHSHAGVAEGECIYISGGVTAQAQDHVPTAHMYSYKPTTRQWVAKASMHCARRLHDMVAVNHKLYTLGGIGPQSYHQQTQIPIESYNCDTDQWTLLVSTLAGRSVGHFIPYRGGILSIGREHYEATEDDMWLYDIESDTWRRFIKAPRRTALASASCAMLYLNFFDDKIARRAISTEKH